MTDLEMDEETLEELFCVLMRVKEGVLAGTVRWPAEPQTVHQSEEDPEEDEQRPTKSGGEDTEADNEAEPEEWDKDPTTFFSRKLQNPRRQRH